jgi:glycosyltransferase involved in cell wall biosynthesis
MNQQQDPFTGKKVAIVHDWLYGGGAELVVEQLHKMFPEAPIYASFCTDEWRKRLNNKVVTGFLQHQPFRKFYKYLGFLRIWWYTHLNLSGYDLIISSSGAEAKGIKVPRGTVHVNYCHAPTHYYWSRYEEYMRNPGFGTFDPIARLGLRLFAAPLREWDYKAAQRPDYIIANSSHIQDEIKKYYHRESTVVFPPVYFERFQKPENQDLPRHGFIISGRQTPYKRFDIAIEACTKLGLPLTVIGDGPDNARLRSLAGPTVTFLGRVPDAELERQFAASEALIFPGLDDFGITPIESMAAGTPVIAYRAGGALDYVIENKTGAFFGPQTTAALIDTLSVFRAYKYTSNDIKTHAQKFSTDTFQKNLRSTLASLLQ